MNKSSSSSRMSSNRHQSVSSPDLSMRAAAAAANRSNILNKSSSSRGLHRSNTAGNELSGSSFLFDLSTNAGAGGGAGGANSSKRTSTSIRISNVGVSGGGGNAGVRRASRLPLSTHINTSSSNMRKSGSSASLSDRFVPMRLSGSQANLQAYLLKNGGGGAAGGGVFGGSDASIPGINDDSPRTQDNKRMMQCAILGNAVGNTSSIASVVGSTSAPSIISYRRDMSASSMLHNSSSSNNISSMQQQQQHPLASSSSNMPRSHKAALYRPGIPSEPSHVLDAPQISNDFYLNILDWGENNLLAVALNSVLYVWNAETGVIEEVVDFDEVNGNNDTGSNEVSISGCRWMCSSGSGSSSSSTIAVGTTANEIYLFDTERKKKLRKMTGHTDRVSSLAWNSWMLASGSKSGIIMLSDVRIPQHAVIQLHGHVPHQEVCGLAWSLGSSPRYLASGSNDNTVQVWSTPMLSDRKSLCATNDAQWPGRGPLLKYTAHTAAVKALAFCPWHENMLATGGGAADCTIKIWHLGSGKMLKNKFADAPVAGIVWNEQYKELISGHGSKPQSLYTNNNSGGMNTSGTSSETTPPAAGGGDADNASSGGSNASSLRKNPITLWKYPGMEKMRELYGHGDRVLALSVNPSRTTVVSASADETIRMWDIWAPTTSTSSFAAASSSLSMGDAGAQVVENGAVGGSQGSKTIRNMMSSNEDDDYDQSSNLIIPASFNKLSIR